MPWWGSHEVILFLKDAVECSILRDGFNRPSSLSECITCSRVTGLSMKCSRTQLVSFRVFSVASSCTCPRRYVASGGLPVFITVRAAVCQQQFFAAKTRSCQDSSLWSWRNCLWPHMPHSNFTHNSFTYNSLTLTQSLFHHLHATHTHFLTHNLLTHNLLTTNSLTRNSLVRTCFTQSAFRHLLSLCCPSHPVFTFLLQLIGRSWHVGLSSPLILNLTWWNSQPMVPKFHVRYLVWLASGVQPHSAISKHDVPRSMRMHREHIQYKTFAYFRSYFNAKIHERTKLPCDQQRPWASNLALKNR